ncbi:MAG: TonB-dependent siderophore receptor [Tolypothrix brevis GSE-NOS-MK-07-07A]|jgi:iron complex outermembrane receptor protein|nr:TonB-dependent siderophore receptor [Tolypothrix brevis GSE-NOS-MK-07-07A]
MKRCDLTVGMRLWLFVGIWVYFAQPGLAEDKILDIPQLSDVELRVTSAIMLVQQPTPTNTPATPGEVVSITGVKAKPTEKGVEMILETTAGDKLQVANRSTGNNFIADITGGQLRLANGEAFTFKSEKPLAGITEITVTNVDANTVRVTVVGEKALPVVELFDDNTGLIFTVASTETATKPPDTPPVDEKPVTEQPEKTQDDPIELVVTGEQDNYRVPDTSVGTRTDTPLRDIPQSIQVVPRQVLQDRQARSITDGLENVSGVTTIGYGSRNYFTIRGFEAFGALVNGLPDPQITSDGSFVNLERLEVLKGPASVLYGDSGTGGVGGTINFVTKQPLRDPFYEIGVTIGSFNDYQGTIDFSGPLNDSKTALYRFNAGYRSTETFVDFNESRNFSIAPSLSFSLGKNTDLAVEGDVNILERNGQTPQGLPTVGTVLLNPNGKVSRSFSPAGPLTDNLTINGRIGYSLEHRFNENWKLRNAFRYTLYNDDDRNDKPDIFPTSLAADNRTLNRGFGIGSQYFNYYYLDTNLLGKFSTGSINHQLLVGFSLNRSTRDLNFEFGTAAPIDIFNPVYDQNVVSTGRSFVNFRTTDTLGIYLQDQITLAENLKLLLGGRVDIFDERTTDRLTNVETSQSDTAFSPRVGIVYQPIPPISLYASFSRSFTPTIGTSAGGEAFEPGRGTQYEVGIKADLTSKLSTTLAFYDLTRSNVTTSDPNNPNFSVQTGEQRSRGIELDISGEILPGWNIIAGYAYNDARVTKDNTIPVGNRLFSAPEHSFNIWTTYKIQKGDLQGLGLGLGFYFGGEVYADLANTVELPSYFRTDAAIFYERERFRAALNFRNLFDVQYYTAWGSREIVYSGDPFTVQGTISWKF